MQKTNALFEETLDWLKQNYSRFRFFVERDLVWTVQMHLLDSIQERGLPYRVSNDYPMLPGKRRAISSDLVILNSLNEAEIAVEFKYEPSHARRDILRSKLPVVSWKDVVKDTVRIQEFVSKGKAKIGYALFIDEAGTLQKHPSPPGSNWLKWAKET